MPTPTRPPFEEVEHTADVALRAFGRTPEELFINAARGMFQLMCDEQPVGEVTHTIRLESLDAESLLVDWLNELIYLSDVEGLVFYRYELTEWEPTRLAATVVGGKVKRRKKAIKAATFSGLAIEKVPGGYSATVVFDV